jgi:hypothetical protein
VNNWFPHSVPLWLVVTISKVATTVSRVPRAEVPVDVHAYDDPLSVAVAA